MQMCFSFSPVHKEEMALFNSLNVQLSCRMGALKRGGWVCSSDLRDDSVWLIRSPGIRSDQDSLPPLGLGDLRISTPKNLMAGSP